MPLGAEEAVEEGGKVGWGGLARSWMLVDVGRPAARPPTPPAPPPKKKCFETGGVFRNSFETPSPSPRINFQQLRNR